MGEILPSIFSATSPAFILHSSAITITVTVFHPAQANKVLTYEPLYIFKICCAQRHIVPFFQFLEPPVPCLKQTKPKGCDSSDAR
ncbi:hypothetical protein DM02DRAFT_619320 [Periconia macrospinosa]|uniref:Uncharacterized protein n=1 Tax=Periconia macrospinosa TaxID=97972 RepID=A0A2V1D5S3_9PLEO|nr:hypothetical protein DM02DRAFT_619320 [Periconia macrospinosa]